VLGCAAPDDAVRTPGDSEVEPLLARIELLATIQMSAIDWVCQRLCGDLLYIPGNFMPAMRRAKLGLPMPLNILRI